MKESKRCFVKSSDSAKDREVDFFCDGWFHVGENASHSFYIREGKNNDFYRASIEFGDRNNVVYVSAHPIEDLTVVYLGHF